MMNNYIILFSHFLISIYAVVALVSCYGFLQIQKRKKLIFKDGHKGVSVLIPCRNESQNIKKLLSDLNDQVIPGKVEVIVIDDHSEDQTIEVASTFSFVKIISLSNSEVGKKAAITKGIDSSNYEIILCLDADIHLNTRFNLMSISSFFSDNKDCHFLLFPIRVIPGFNFFSIVHLLEHFALTNFLFGSYFVGNPILSHGACMAFRKSKFEEVGGFRNNLHYASGDDIFLMKEMHLLNQKAVQFPSFSFDPVSTTSVTSFQEFFSQRVRWASKFNKTGMGLSFYLALLIAFTNAWLLLGGILTFINFLPLKTYLIALIIKFMIDFLLLFLTADYFKQKRYLGWFPLFFWIYPFLAIFISLSVLFVKVKWKDRVIS